MSAFIEFATNFTKIASSVIRPKNVFWTKTNEFAKISCG